VFSPKTNVQLETALAKLIPYVVFIDKKKLEETNTVQVKDLSAREQKDIKRTEVVEYLKRVFG